MKIQCDVCNKDEASVFCSADEAALCDGCDRRVHHANKLASKHHRFSLLHPSCKDAPRCDICQERRAFLFCREDRAILCRECDFPIHTANELTKKHNRFLLTGVKLSSTSAVFPSNGCDAAADSKRMNDSQPFMKKDMPIIPVSVSHQEPIQNNTSTPSKGSGCVDHTTGSDGGSTSSISEYLMETLPGWHVEDFLDSSSPTHGFCKNDDLLPVLDANLETNLGCFASDNLAIWVPQAPPPPHPPPQINGYKDGLFKELKASNPNPKISQRWRDHGFMVPQINPPSIKRSRPTW